MIKNKTIFIAHGWSDVSLNLQSKALAISMSADNKVIFLNAKKDRIREINENLLVCEWPGKRPTGIKDLWFALRLFMKYRPHIIVTNFAANDIMLFVSWLFRTPVRACYYHTLVQQHIEDFGKLDMRQHINIFRKGFAFRLATHMLPSTVAAKKELIKYYKVKPGRAFIFPNALPGTDIRNTNSSDIIGFLGRLNKSKGVDLLIRAFGRLSEKVPGARLVITGTGKEMRNLQQLSNDLGLRDKILFKGAISYTEILPFLGSLSFLVVPSRMDNLPTVALEALSVATPVIGSNAGGIPDIITPGYNGLLFQNENVDDLYHQMLFLLKDNEARKQMSLNARRSFEEKYCMDDHRERFEKLIENHLS